jgi:hypothetical protein
MDTSNVEETDTHNLPTALRAAVVPGTTASLFSAAALAVCSLREVGHAAAAINGPSQWIWGEDEGYTRHATWRNTAVGYATHHLSAIFWATLHELAFNRPNTRQRATGGDKSVPRICAEAVATTATAYFVDYHLTPQRLRPGFEKHLGPLSMFAVYAAFAVGLAAAGLARHTARRSQFIPPPL